MESLTTFGLGIAINIASNGIEFISKKLNIYHCSKKVKQEIDDAYKDAVNSWSKNLGVQDAKYPDHLKIIRELSNNSSDHTLLDKEDIEFLSNFKYALADRNNAWRYLTFELLENRFSEIIKLQANHSSNQTEKLGELKNDHEEIKLKIDILSDQLKGEIEMKFDKSDALKKPSFFLTEIPKNFDGYIARKVQREKNTDELILSSLNENDLTLKELVSDKNIPHIILKGQPGIGKSIELQRLAHDFWNDNNTDLIPFYRNLRDFTNTDNISDFFSLNELNQYVNVVYILDGLDEIKDGENFLSKFKTHLNNRKNISHRYILSCRSNILESFKSDLNNFEIFELQELSLKDSQSLLKYKTSKLFSIRKLYEFQIKSSFISDPFKLNLVSEFYKEYKRLEPNPILLWDNYIQSITKRDKYHKQRKKELKYFKLISDSQLISFLLECTKSLQFSDDELIKVLSESEERFGEFINSAIVLAKENYYYFEHKQLQEYLAAKFISSYKTEMIFEIFKIKSLDSIHPNLENVFTLLVNLLDFGDEKLEKILSWIEVVKPDMLFKADTDRIEKFKIPIFQSYFKKECEDTTLWIGNTTSVSVEEIARFADCPKNLSFLLSYLKDEEQHFRVRISALNLLEYFKPKKTNDLKKELFKILSHSDARIYLKANVIQLIEKWKFVDQYPNIIHDTIKVFENEEHSEISSRILRLIETDNKKIDEYFDYIKKEFNFSFGKKKRLNDDEVIRGNDWKVENLMLELNEKENFLELLTEYFKKNHFKHHYPKYKEEKIVETLRRFKKLDPDIIFELVKPIVTDNHFNPNYKDDFIVRIINEFDENFRLFKWLFKTQDFSKCKWLMARIANEKCIRYYIDNWIKVLGKANGHLEGFRNIVSSYHPNEKWRIEIEKSYTDEDIPIKESLMNMTPFDELKNQYKEKVKQELKLLFKPDELIDSLKQFFKQLKTKNITRKDLHDDFFIKENRNDKFLWSFGYRGIIYELVNNLLIQDKNEVSIIDCKEYIEEPKSFIFFIKSEVKTVVDNDKIELDVFFLQKDLNIYIQNLLEGLKVTDILEYVNRSKFKIKNGKLENYNTFHIIQAIHELLLIQNLDLKLTDDFLINTLEYFDIKSFDENQSKLEKYLSKINDKDALSSKIIENLSKPLFSSVYLKHAFYALENNLHESFDDIEQYLLTSDEIRSELSLLNNYIDKNGPEILLEMMSESESVACWKAVEISMKREVHKKECISKAKRYLETTEIRFEKDAAKVLFKTNQPEIIRYIKEDLKERIQIIRGMHTSYLKDYNILPNDEIAFVEQLFNVIYNDYEEDRFEKAALNEFFRNYLINIAKQKGNYEKLNKELQQIKVSPKTLESDNRRFFINLIIDECEKAYINEMSKPMSFKEALKLVKEIEI